MRVCDLVDVSLRAIFNMQQKIICSPQTGPQSSSNSCSHISIKTNKNRLKFGGGRGKEKKKKKVREKKASRTEGRLSHITSSSVSPC